MKSLIVVVDPEPQICELARNCLEAAGYIVQTPLTARRDAEVAAEPPCLIVVSMSVLKQDGLAISHQYASNSLPYRTPWLVLLDTASPRDRMIALNYGASDCVVKPFSPSELVSRVKGVLHRSVHSTSVSNVESADIVIDNWAMRVVVRGIEVSATTLEFRLLEYLARHPRQVFTRDFLLDAVWGDLRFINPRSVDACIRRIREKIETDSTKPTMLKTVRGVGYRMDGVAAWQSAPTDSCDCPACRRGISALQFYEAGPKRRRALVQG